MQIEFEHRSGKSRADISKGHDLSIPVNKRRNVSCYYLDAPEFKYFKSEAFSGELKSGGSVNCERISLYPHASGTHTECALHVLETDFDMRHILLPPLMMCHLFSITPTVLGDDRVIDRKATESLHNNEQYDAVIIRTLPNSESKKFEDYSGSNPPYFDPELLLHLRSLGYKHILTDLPSIDKESDEGRLSAHKNWFLTGGVPDRTITITELIYVPDTVADGAYALSIQIPSIETDAVPSRILIYPCQ